MAGIYPNINFPQVDFTPLGKLPAVAEEGRIRSLRASLGDLDPSKPDQIEKAAGRLIAGGDVEGGMRLYQAATARRGVEQRGEADRAYMQYLKTIKPGTIPGGPVGDATTPEPFVFGPGGTPVPATPPPSARPGPNLFEGPPASLNSIPGVQGALPGPTVAAAEPPPPTPSEEILAAAEQGPVPPPARGPQLAQAGGPTIALPPVNVGPKPAQVPDVTAATPQPQLLPSWLQGAQLQAVPGAAPSTGPAPGTPVISRSPVRISAQAEANDILREMQKLGPKARGTPEGAQLQARLTDALQRGRASPQEVEYATELAQRAQRGEPFITQQEFRTLEKTAPEAVTEARKIYLAQEVKGNKARELLPTLDRLDQITKDPNFVSGRLANLYEEVVSGLGTVAAAAGRVLPQGFKDTLNKIADPHMKAAALIAEFKSLANSSVLASATSLAQGFSEGDRRFMERMFPSILATPDGIERVSKYLRAMALHSEEAARTLREHMKERDVRVTPMSVYDTIQEYHDKHPLFADKNGRPTALGRELSNAAGQPLFPPEPRPEPPPTETSRTDQRARGGPVAPGRSYMVGERGPEMFVPRQSGTIVPSQRLTGLAALQPGGGVPPQLGNMPMRRRPV